MYFRSLAWRILTIILLACEMSAGCETGWQTKRKRLPLASALSTAKWSYSASEVRGDVQRSHLVSQVRGSGREEPLGTQGWGGGREEPPCTRGQGRCPGGEPHVQGAVATWAQEGLEEPSHVKGQEGR